MLMGRPGYSFDCSDVVGKLCLRLRTIVETPYLEFIVISSRGELLLIEAPFQAADLLLMTC